MNLRFDNNKIVSGAADDSLRIWDMHSGECIQILQVFPLPLAICERKGSQRAPRLMCVWCVLLLLRATLVVCVPIVCCV
jgi:WD40 repeat protein